MDWAALPSDLLILIFEAFLVDIPDILRAAAACSSWRGAFAAMRLLPPRPPRQTPWLMFHGVADCDPTSSHFCSLSEKRIYTLSLPDPPIRTRLCIGSSDGWLITADERAELYLLNPITGAQISLPPIKTLEHITVCDIGGEITEYMVYDHGNNYYHSVQPEELRDFLYNKAVMSCAPLEGDCIVMLLHNPHWQLSYARPGDKRWNPFTMKDGLCYYDCIYHSGLFYAITFRRCIQVWDLSGSTPQSKIILPAFDASRMGEMAYLVQAPWGDLLQVWRYRKYFDDNDPCVKRTVKIEVYKWVDGRQPRMEKMTSIGEHTLFLGSNRSFCLPTKNFPCIKPNCVYLTDDDLEIAGYNKEDERDVGIYHLKDGSFEHVLPAKALLNWPPPIWITPSLI